MSEKIVLIDGHSILHRAYYGMPDLTTAEGLHTGAIYGFLMILFKILEEEKPEYLTIAFDVHGPTFRHEMYSEYKGTRKPMDDELRQQIPVLKDVLHAMGIRTAEKQGLEGDDILGIITTQMEQAGIQVSLISGDRDLLQLATDKTLIRIPKTRQGKTEIENYYASDVKEKYQVTPTEFIDVKALMGDSSDNVPGVPSIGEKTATKIIVNYGSIENAYAHIEEITPNRAKSALMEHYDLAVKSKELVTILREGSIDFSLEDAKIDNLYTPEAFEWFGRLNFKQFLNRFSFDTPKQKIEEYFKEIKTSKEAEAVISKALQASTVGLSFFVEPNPLPLFQHLSGLKGIGLSFSEKDIYCIQIGGGIEKEDVIKWVAQINSTVETVSIYDVKSFIKEIPLAKNENCFDIHIASYLLNPLKSDYSYIDIANEQLDLLLQESTEQEKTAYYISYVSYASMAILKKKLENKNMWELFRTIEMPLVFSLDAMERVGILVEAKGLKFYGDELHTKIGAIEKEIYAMANTEFNINSPKQLGQVLFEEMKLPGGKKTKTGYSTAADVLEKMANEHPIVDKILEYRTLTKLKSTYADGLAGCIAEDGRIHGRFNQTITATGRISSTEPNLQNIPVRMELGRLIRKVFIPAEGFHFVDADYSQIELRILAHCSEDPVLIEAYKQEKDIHRITASEVFHVPFEDVTDLQRRNAKAVNFGIVYGISSFGLSQDLSITRKEASTYIDAYFATYPGVKKFLDETVELAKEQGFVTTLFGRIRPIPELSSSNFMQRSFGERVAMNSPIQGTAADIMKIAMLRVDEKLKENKLKSRLVLQVHDELLVETALEETEQVKEILKREMENAASLLVPLVVDMHTGKNWYEAK